MCEDKLRVFKTDPLWWDWSQAAEILGDIKDLTGKDTEQPELSWLCSGLGSANDLQRSLPAWVEATRLWVSDCISAGLWWFSFPTIILYHTPC